MISATRSRIFGRYYVDSSHFKRSLARWDSGGAMEHSSLFVSFDTYTRLPENGFRDGEARKMRIAI